MDGFMIFLILSVSSMCMYIDTMENQFLREKIKELKGD